MQVFFDISIAVCIKTAVGAGRGLRIQFHLPLLTIGHSIMIRIDWWSPAGKVRITANLVWGIDYSAGPVFHIFDYVRINRISLRYLCHGFDQWPPAII